MKKGKILALLLSLSMVCAAFPAKTAAAVGGSGDGESGSAEGMEYTKTATDNGDGTYTIKLEAYATGEKLIIDGKKDKPADIVLVLDQSGSMAEYMNSYGFREYANKNNEDFYRLRHNGGRSNLYYRMSDGSYASVSVTYQDAYSYEEISDRKDNSYYYENREKLYALVNGEYQKVTVSFELSWGGVRYRYRLPDRTIIAESTGRDNSPTFNNIDGSCLYLVSANESQREYSYSYTDAEGNLIEIETSVGANAAPEHTFYERYVSDSTSKLSALRTAVTNFADSVSEKAAGEDGIPGTEDDVNHRIAVVGYAYNSSGSYSNTEVFIGSDQYRYNSGYGQSAQDVYDRAFQNMDTPQGRSNVAASIGALTASGATYTNLGVEMANGILNANPVEEDEERSRIVIVFTDGEPGYSGYDPDVAAAAIQEASSIKNGGATVYTVGIFEGADATENGISDSVSEDVRRVNAFMQGLSSNNGTPQDPSYYLSAADAETLNNIFEQISDNIEQGGSDTTLDKNTVIRDWVAESFELPEGTTGGNIALETYRCTGKTGEEYTWEKNPDAMGAHAAVNAESGEVEVTGFNFAENYVGTVTENGETSYRGNKLVISFTIEPKEGFLGGNQVPTNSSAGIYESGDAEEPVFEYEVPVVDVPIEEITVTAPDKDIYLLQDVSPAELRQGTTVKVGDVNLDLTEENYGLEDWQYAYVQIQDEFTANGGQLIGDMTDLREDTSYTATVTVMPEISEGKAEPQTGSDEGNINVYKPELTYQDSNVYYGGTAPADNTYATVNLTDTKWKHTDAEGTVTEADVETMGRAPELGIMYVPEAGKIEDGKINTKEDIAVDAVVKIEGEDVTADTGFVHTRCEGETQDLANGKFWLHVKTCSLTIAKKGGAEGEPYAFEIYKDNEPYTEITITGNGSVTIGELPVGEYKIEEAEDWSWRYTPTYENNGVILNANNPSGTITCTNEKDNDHWLNDFSTAVKNVYGEANSD